MWSSQPLVGISVPESRPFWGAADVEGSIFPPFKAPTPSSRCLIRNRMDWGTDCPFRTCTEMSTGVSPTQGGKGCWSLEHPSLLQSTRAGPQPSSTTSGAPEGSDKCLVLKGCDDMRLGAERLPLGVSGSDDLYPYARQPGLLPEERKGCMQSWV